MRIWFPIAGICIFVQSLFGQAALSRSEVIRANTCLGSAEVRSSPAEPSSDIVVALFGDTLRDDELAHFRDEIGLLYQAAESASSLRLAVIFGGNIRFAGPFRTRQELQTVVAEITRASPGIADAVQPLGFYAYLGKLAPQLGANWSALVLVGHFPVVDRDVFAYTAAWLATEFRSAKLRVSYWFPSGEGSELLDVVSPATSGMRSAEDLASLPPLLKQNDEFREIAWQDPMPSAGWRICPITLVGANGQPAIAIPYIARASGIAVPDIERYAYLREKIKSLAAILRAPQLSPEQAVEAEGDLSAALEISPRDEEALRLGAGLYKRLANDPKLAAALTALTEMAPDDAALFADLGHARFRMHDWEAAEGALLKARKLLPGDASIAEELARIRLTRNDDRGALPLLEETLAARPGTQELWLLRAGIATRLNDWRRTADSLEHAIALGTVSLQNRTTLVRAYLDHQMPDRALLHVRAVAANLPPETSVRSEYASFLDQLQQPEEALAAWKRALETDAKLEQAHYRVTRILLDQNAVDQALQSAEGGIQASPQSARLYLAKAEALEKLDRFYLARRTLRQASPVLGDPALLAHLAEMEDAGGKQAARYYRELTEALEKSGALLIEQIDPLERGFQAALREGDLEDAAWFRSRLPAGARVAAPARPRVANAAIPGGLAALGFIATSKATSPDRFLVEYARTTVRYLEFADHEQTAKKEAEAYTAKIREHFQRIEQLAALGLAQKDRVKVVIDVGDKQARKNAEKILALLGWKLRTSRQGVQLEVAEKGPRAKRQETASALAIDEVGMQQTLEAGKVFSFEIPMETANVVLGEEAWRAQFYPKEKPAGGLAEAMAGNLQLAETYAALGQMDPNTAAVLAAGLGLKTLAEKYSTLLMQYSSALAVERGRAAVPGGESADAIWTALAGVTPRQPGPFFRALLAKDNGKLFAYYAALSELDMRHQRFFTRTSARTGKFYELFKDAPESRSNSTRRQNSGSFIEFLSEVPLDADGNVDFPGSAEVWIVAKGQSRSTSDMTKMIKKLKRAVAPEVEDEILLRLARTRYTETVYQHNELDNFLAVIRIDQHRSDLLNEASALLLAQRFATDDAVYPFFAALTGLEQKHFEQFFALADAWHSLSDTERNAQLASLYSLIEIVCLARQADKLNDEQSAELFGRIVERLRQAASPPERTAASLDLLREILTVGGGPPATSPDDVMRNLLLGSAASSEVEVDGAVVALDPSALRHSRFQRVLELQKAPTLATVLALSDAARNLGAGRGPAAAQIQVLESRAAGLFAVEIPKEVKGKQRELVEGFQPRRLQELVRQFRQKTAAKKVNPKDLEKLSYEYLKELDAPVRWALEGVVYAYFLSPDDLLVSEDPLLLRKHEFVNITPGPGASRLFLPASLKQTSEGAGSRFVGGFADFAGAAGYAAAESAKLGGESGEFIAAKQMSAIRSTEWKKLRDEDLRLLGLKITVAREWIVRAAAQPELETSLAEAALGLLSLTRRAELRDALANGDWPSVWDVVTLSDLYFLAGRYLERYSADPWQSPATRALRQLIARNDGARLQSLGPEFDDTFGCSHPHLRIASPYEEYEKDLLPRRLAERTAEFKLYLARYADAEGIPASALEALAEPAARAILMRMRMNDRYDWHSALAAYSTLDSKLVGEALTKR